MIITEKITINDREFVRTYSDEGRYVCRDGVSYVEAIDPIDSGREYTEGDIMVNQPTGGVLDTETIEKAQAYDILMGVSE